MAPELPSGVERAAIDRGVNALVDRMVRLDSDLSSGRFFMDVRRREALRIAADWARLAPSEGALPPAPETGHAAQVPAPGVAAPSSPALPQSKAP
jgi:hypothetical protein